MIVWSFKPRRTLPHPVEELEATLLPFGESRMLPRAAYVDEGVFGWEQRHFFDGQWMCVGRSEQLAEPGDQRAESLGTAGVLLTRGQDGSCGPSPTCAATAATSCCRAGRRPGTVG